MLARSSKKVNPTAEPSGTVRSTPDVFVRSSRAARRAAAIEGFATGVQAPPRGRRPRRAVIPTRYPPFMDAYLVTAFTFMPSDFGDLTGVEFVYEDEAAMAV